MDSVERKSTRVQKRSAEGDRLSAKQKLKRLAPEVESDVSEEVSSSNMAVDDTDLANLEEEEGSDDDEVDWEEVPVPGKDMAFTYFCLPAHSLQMHTDSDIPYFFSSGTRAAKRTGGLFLRGRRVIRTLAVQRSGNCV